MVELGRLIAHLIPNDCTANSGLLEKKAIPESCHGHCFGIVRAGRGLSKAAACASCAPAGAPCSCICACLPFGLPSFLTSFPDCLQSLCHLGHLEAEGLHSPGQEEQFLLDCACPAAGTSRSTCNKARWHVRSNVSICPGLCNVKARVACTSSRQKAFCLELLYASPLRPIWASLRSPLC